MNKNSSEAIAYEVRANNRTQRIVVRNDVAQEYAEKLKAHGYESVEIRALFYEQPLLEISDETLQLVADAVIDYRDNGDPIYYDGLREIIKESSTQQICNVYHCAGDCGDRH